MNIFENNCPRKNKCDFPSTTDNVSQPLEHITAKTPHRKSGIRYTDVFNLLLWTKFIPFSTTQAKPSYWHDHTNGTILILRTLHDHVTSHDHSHLMWRVEFFPPPCKSHLMWPFSPCMAILIWHLPHIVCWFVPSTMQKSPHMIIFTLLGHSHLHTKIISFTSHGKIPKKRHTATPIPSIRYLLRATNNFYPCSPMEKADCAPSLDKKEMSET